MTDNLGQVTPCSRCGNRAARGTGPFPDLCLPCTAYKAWVVQFGGDGLCCSSCEQESESWHLMHARLDDPEPQWLCLSCTAPAMRREQNRRIRAADYPPKKRTSAAQGGREIGEHT